MNFTEYFIHFRTLYGTNNSMFLDGINGRLITLHHAVNDFRRFVGSEKQSAYLAVLFARVYTVVDHFHDIPLDNALFSKYPPSGCGYCNKMKCKCNPLDRDEHDETLQEGEWQLNDFQNHLNAVYGEVNKQGGIEKAIKRIFEEMSEVNSLTGSRDCIGLTAKQIEWQFCLELSDVFAWVIALANLCNVNLQDVVGEIYGNGCYVCGEMPCGCKKTFDHAFTGSMHSL